MKKRTQAAQCSFHLVSILMLSLKKLRKTQNGLKLEIKILIRPKMMEKNPNLVEAMQIKIPWDHLIQNHKSKYSRRHQMMKLSRK